MMEPKDTGKIGIHLSKKNIIEKLTDGSVDRDNDLLHFPRLQVDGCVIKLRWSKY